MPSKETWLFINSAGLRSLDARGIPVETESRFPEVLTSAVRCG